MEIPCLDGQPPPTSSHIVRLHEGIAIPILRPMHAQVSYHKDCGMSTIFLKKVCGNCKNFSSLFGTVRQIQNKAVQAFIYTIYCVSRPILRKKHNLQRSCALLILINGKNRKHTARRSIPILPVIGHVFPVKTGLFLISASVQTYPVQS